MKYSGYYYKLVGSDEGVVSVRGVYERFTCLGCMYARGLLRARHQGPPTGAMVVALARPVVHRHDKDLHARWVAAGKPAGGIPR